MGERVITFFVLISEPEMIRRGWQGSGRGLVFRDVLFRKISEPEMIRCGW